MTWSLQLRNGDLTLGDAHYGAVTGGAKLVQDFRSYLLEEMGSDPMHPAYGSLIQGGVTPNGMRHLGAIGQPTINATLMEIRSEINRVAQAIQSAQLARARSDRNRYGKVTLTKSEVLLGLEDISFDIREDQVTVRITLRTGDDSNLLFTLALEGTTLAALGSAGN